MGWTVTFTIEARRIHRGTRRGKKRPGCSQWLQLYSYCMDQSYGMDNHRYFLFHAENCDQEWGTDLETEEGNGISTLNLWFPFEKLSEHLKAYQCEYPNERIQIVEERFVNLSKEDSEAITRYNELEEWYQRTLSYLAPPSHTLPHIHKALLNIAALDHLCANILSLILSYYSQDLRLSCYYLFC
jgi:hypothetical protein